MKTLEEKNFNELVDELAGHALTEFVGGAPWRSIFFYVCQTTVLWKTAQDQKKSS